MPEDPAAVRVDLPPEPQRERGGGTIRFFLRGLGVVLPSVLTIWILVAAYRFVDSNIAEPINAGLRLGVTAAASVAELPQFEPAAAELAAEQERATRLRLDATQEASRWRLIRENVANWWGARWYLDLAGLLLAIGAVYLLGRLVGGYLGRRLLRAFESGLLAVPGIRQVYPALKQVVEFLFGSENRKLDFSRVVMIEYPRPGVWAIGLVTGDAAPGVQATVGDGLTVFVPSSPTPFTGWTVTVPRGDVREVPFTVDEALRYLVSAGVVTPARAGGEPARRQTPGAAEAQRP